MIWFVIFVGIVIVTVMGCAILNIKEKVDADYTDCGTDRSVRKGATIYEKYVKRALDIVISFIGIVLSAPIVVVFGIAIYIEDPGNVIFKQKRIGINNTFFNIHKLRSMRKNTGDIPTHLLSKEDQDNMILKVGRFIRKTSIDELPQLVDILRGRMSLIGPRPALWNQDDLISKREEYGVNDVRPGLTGWAQINGRDSIEIDEKASLDKVYRDALRNGNVSGIVMDSKCFWGTISSVLKSEGVVEGGTGSIGRK